MKGVVLMFVVDKGNNDCLLDSVKEREGDIVI